jgi:aspartyl-tRNA(Asn)/glutamyl-tRNA(Gln) amidotransferase subunit A
LSAGYYDAYYAKAQKVRRLIQEKTERDTGTNTILYCTAAPNRPFPIGKEEKDPVVMYLSDIFTVQASLTGVPAISIPTGNNSKGLPLGLQSLHQQ